MKSNTYDWSDLYKLYIDDKLSAREISEIKKCDMSTVWVALKRMSIPTRNNSEANKIYISRYGMFSKGKTFEEIYGVDRAKEIKERTMQANLLKYPKKTDDEIKQRQSEYYKKCKCNGKRFRLSVCPNCGSMRYVTEPIGHDRLCRSCSMKKRKFKHGENNACWKGGKWKEHTGYVLVYISPESPYYAMARKNSHIQEHRLIVAQHLGRCLALNEHVHHINGIKDDNRIENLKLMSQREHNEITRLCSECNLRKEIRLLRWQIKEQSEQIRLLTSKLLGV